MDKARVLAIGVGFCLSLMPGQIFAQGKEKISVSCSKISVKDCTDQIPVKVSLDPSIVSKTVTIQFKDRELSEGLRSIMDAAGVSNYVLQFDKEKRTIIISSAIGSVNVVNAASASPGPSSQGKSPTPTGDQRQASAPQVTPSAEKLEELAKIAATGSHMDLDTGITLPTGEVATIRQLQATQERVSLVTLAPTQQIQIPGIAAPMTVQELNDRQSSANRSYEKITNMSSNGTSSGATPPSFPVVKKNSPGGNTN